MKDFSYITNSSPAFIENLYREFVKDPESIDPEMKKFFEGFDFAVISGAAVSKGEPQIEPEARVSQSSKSNEFNADFDWKGELAAYRLILGYRNKGHLIAKTNPIRERKDRGANIDISFYGFSESDLSKEFYIGTLLGLGKSSLQRLSLIHI